MRHVVFPVHIGPTIASSVPGAGASWEGGCAGVSLDNPWVGHWRIVFLIVEQDTWREALYRTNRSPWLKPFNLSA